MRYDIAIIGGGIVGLASAFKILERHAGLKLVVLEKENSVATHQTDRNSGVIHSGIYYKPGSAKALNCVKGAAMLIDFCRDQGTPFELCGKVIVAGLDNELPVLDSIYQRGLQNGLNGIKMIDATEVKDIEPHCFAIKGIWVPQAGIIDYRVVANRLMQLIIEKGGEVITSFRVEKIKERKDSLVIYSAHQDVESRMAIGCAGLYADHLASLAGLKPPHQIVPFRGEFYTVVGEAEKLVRGLIYPVPDINFPFLGVHLTTRIGGGIEAGPNAVFAFRREGYRHLDIHAGELWESITYKGFQHLALKHWRKGMDEMARSFSARWQMRTFIPSPARGRVSKCRQGPWQ